MGSGLSYIDRFFDLQVSPQSVRGSIAYYARAAGDLATEATTSVGTVQPRVAACAVYAPLVKRLASREQRASPNPSKFNKFDDTFFIPFRSIPGLSLL